jgi:EAL domain-containing protein (putative c-di-GMP-specific phosphodiesterase class I)
MQRTPTPSQASGAPPSKRVLLAEDDAAVSRALQRSLGAAGYDVMVVGDGNAALEVLQREAFDVILSDIHMPGTSGVDLLRVIRTYDLDVPLILITAEPELETTLEALELGAFGYLRKPVDHEQLLRSLARAVRLGGLARLHRDAMKELGETVQPAADVAGMSAAFDRMLQSFWMAFQPIVDVPSRRVIAYEALLRSREPTLPHPGAVLSAAERLGRVEDLGRQVRARTTTSFGAAPPGALLFVNLHPNDLLDAELPSQAAPLSAIASRVVLEITERAALEHVRDIERRISVLRYMGFRIAVDDLGAGYAGLTSLARLEPDFVKLDMSLVRGVHQSPVRQRLVRAMNQVCADSAITVIAEGVETPEERDQLGSLGCHLMQGYLFAKPQEGFVSVFDR